MTETLLQFHNPPSTVTVRTTGPGEGSTLQTFLLMQENGILSARIEIPVFPFNLSVEPASKEDLGYAQLHMWHGNKAEVSLLAAEEIQSLHLEFLLQASGAGTYILGIASSNGDVQLDIPTLIRKLDVNHPLNIVDGLMDDHAVFLSKTQPGELSDITSHAAPFAPRFLPPSES